METPNNFSFNKSHSFCAVCLLSKEDESWLCHKRIIYIHMDHLNKLVCKKLVIGLSNISFENNKVCDMWQKGNKVKAIK